MIKWRRPLANTILPSFISQKVTSLCILLSPEVISETWDRVMSTNQRRGGGRTRGGAMLLVCKAVVGTQCSHETTKRGQLAARGGSGRHFRPFCPAQISLKCSNAKRQHFPDTASQSGLCAKARSSGTLVRLGRTIQQGAKGVRPQAYIHGTVHATENQMQ